MRLLSFLEENAAAYELTQRLVSLNYRLFLRELRVEDFFEPGKSYLDVGCGTGFLRDHLKDADYLGVDLNPNYIAAAQHRRGDCFQVGDALHLDAIGRLRRFRSSSERSRTRTGKSSSTLSALSGSSVRWPRAPCLC